MGVINLLAWKPKKMVRYHGGTSSISNNIFEPGLSFCSAGAKIPAPPVLSGDAATLLFPVLTSCSGTDVISTIMHTS